MRRTRNVSLFAVVLLAGLGAQGRSDEVKEKAFDASHDVKVKVRMEGPYTADMPLQVVCYFKYSPEVAKRMSGAPVELDRHLGGVIAFEVAQPLLICEAAAAVFFEHDLIERQSRRADGVADVHFAVEKVGVAGIEQPSSVVAADRDASVAEGVAGQRDERDVRGDAVERAHFVEAEP